MMHLLLLCLLHSAIAKSQRRLSPESSIADELNAQLTEGVAHPRFTITANYNEGSGDNLFIAEPFEIDVVLSNSSVGDGTTFSAEGIHSPVSTSTKLLVADDSNFAIIAVDEDGSVKGLVQKDSMIVSLEQSDGAVVVVNQVQFEEEDWECLTREEEEHAHDPEYEDGNRRRMHTNGSKHAHEHNLPQLFPTPNRKLYATDTFPNAWSYQVDLYIEVDDAFVANRDTDTVNMPNTINYVNALVSGVSSIYEREIDTHCELHL